MKDIVIDGRLQRVFVLLENANRVVYIALKSIHKVDYERLLEIEKLAGKQPMLEIMKNYTLPKNNRNALQHFEHIIQVAEKSDSRQATRIRKPGEPEAALDDEKAENDSVKANSAPTKRRGGRPKGSVNKPKPDAPVSIEPSTDSDE